MRIILTYLLSFQALLTAHAAFNIATDTKAKCVIVRHADATPAEIKAAEELAATLQQMTGATFEIKTNADASTKATIIVGPGTFASQLFPDVPFDKLGPDEIVMHVKGDKLLLAGGRPRGTIYSVYRFLQEQCGVRYWAPWATNVPHKTTLRVPNLNVRYTPPFEYRGPFWYSGFEQKWKVHNQSNNESWFIPPELGGCIHYKGFCHTFYQLIPPDKYFAEHPEWFSMVNGKRTTENAQLCLTNPKLRDMMVQRVKEWMRESPDAQIISVTQNDCFGFCECPDCKALDDAEGSHAGTMVAFANYIAEHIEAEFPNVAVDTFAYQYTRKPPKTIKPRHNVIIRLCSIECNFREPLDHPSNASFADDIRGWSKLCQRLYIWDYTTEFKNYVHPHPNWFTLGPNVRFFQQHGVKGLFEQGAYAGYGAEMSEMRSWVLAQLMWNPAQDDRALIKEFLQGYYGNEAGKFIYQYLELVHKSSEGLFLGCYLRKEPPSHLRFEILGRAEELWQAAEKSVQNDPEKLLRVRLGHLPVHYAILKYWKWLRHDCWEQNLKWPLSESRKAVAEEFRTVCQGVQGKDWTTVRALNEQGFNVDEFLKGFVEEPKPVDAPPPLRLKHPHAPSDLKGAKNGIDLQDNVASLSGFGKWAKILADEDASDKRAVWMPGDHSEWAFRISGASLPAKAKAGKWKVYAVLRVQKGSAAATTELAFSAGVYDNKEKTYPANFKANLADVKDGYHSYLVGEVEFNADRDIWVAPASNPEVKSMWVDRIYLVPAK